MPRALKTGKSSFCGAHRDDGRSDGRGAGQLRPGLVLGRRRGGTTPRRLRGGGNPGRRTLRVRVLHCLAEVEREGSIDHGMVQTRPLLEGNAERKKIWRIRASIPLPRACEARALPSELNPLHQVNSGF